MEQLLRITTTPLKYELEIEHPKLEYKQGETTPQYETTRAKLTVDNQSNVSVNINTYQSRKSLGVMDSTDFSTQNADASKQALSQKIGEYAQLGSAMSQIQNGVSVGDIYRQKMLDSTNYQLYTAFLPSSGAELTWNPSELNMSYEPGSTSIDWNVSQSEFNFIPGSVRMKVTQLASVNIEYLGGPLYFPPSAAQKAEGETAAE